MSILLNAESVTETVDITRYERAHKVEMYNPLGRTPRILFRTSWVERDNTTGEETQREMCRTLEELYDPQELFDLLGVEGGASYEQVFGLLYSLFFHVAGKADA